MAGNDETQSPADTAADKAAEAKRKKEAKATEAKDAQIKELSEELTEAKKKLKGSGVDEGLQRKKDEQAAKAAEAKDTQIGSLGAEIAGLKKSLTATEEERDTLKASLETVTSSRDTLRGKLEEGQASTLKLVEGEVQLVESATIIAKTFPETKSSRGKGRRVSARLGDVLVVEATPDVLQKVQERIGANHRVYAVDEEQVKDLLKSKYAIAG